MDELDGMMVPRELLINSTKYDTLKEKIMELKKIYSSSCLTGLQNDADTKQRWPLLNIVRQILNVHHYEMEPIRKSDGYTLEGVKKFRRYFFIKKRINQQINDEIK
jgi:hypothetical protein